MAEENKTNSNPTGAIANQGAVPPKVEKTEETKSKKIEVDAETLQKVLDKVEKQEKEIEILREVADKNRLGRVEELRLQGKLVKSVNLNTLNGKIIMGWKKIKDDVYIDQQGRLHEEQIVGLIFLDDDTGKPQTIKNNETGLLETFIGKEIDIRSFSRLVTKIAVEVIEEGKDKEGNVNFTIQTKDGREIKIDSKFVN